MRNLIIKIILFISSGFMVLTLIDTFPILMPHKTIEPLVFKTPVEKYIKPTQEEISRENYIARQNWDFFWSEIWVSLVIYIWIIYFSFLFWKKGSG